MTPTYFDISNAPGANSKRERNALETPPHSRHRFTVEAHESQREITRALQQEDIAALSTENRHFGHFVCGHDAVGDGFD
jgi:hypothetical protein